MFSLAERRAISTRASYISALKRVGKWLTKNGKQAEVDGATGCPILPMAEPTLLAFLNSATKKKDGSNSSFSTVNCYSNAVKYAYHEDGLEMEHAMYTHLNDFLQGPRHADRTTPPN
jgi:hypothetical protein